MAINKQDRFKFTESLGSNSFTRAGNVAVGAVGGAVATVASISLLKSLHIGDAVNAVFDWDTVRAAAGVAGGGLLLGSVYQKYRYPDDPNKKETVNISRILGIGILAATAISFAFTGEDNNSQNSTNTTQQEVTSTYATVANGNVCEINIPYTSDDTQSVLKMQAALNESGFGIIHVDGINGDQTKTALSNFKVANGFDPGTEFNAEMCALLPSLVDGDENTPNIGVVG